VGIALIVILACMSINTSIKLASTAADESFAHLLAEAMEESKAGDDGSENSGGRHESPPHETKALRKVEIKARTQSRIKLQRNAPQLPPPPPPPTPPKEPGEWPEPDILRNVAIDDTIVVFLTTCPYIDFLENALTSLEKIGYTNYVIVPLDSLTASRVTQLWPEHVVSVPPLLGRRGTGAHLRRPATFNSQAFKKITSSRPHILKAFMSSSTNLNVIYSDTDTVWQTPKILPRFKEIVEQNPSTRMIATSEVDEIDKGIMCSGLLYIPKAEAAEVANQGNGSGGENTDVGIIEFLSIWEAAMKTGKHLHDQEAMYDAYEQIRKRPNGAKFMHILPLNDSQFPVGKPFFTEFTPQQRQNTYVVHNNWIMGKPAKRERFNRFGYWISPGKVYQLPNPEECGAY